MCGGWKSEREEREIERRPIRIASTIRGVATAAGRIYHRHRLERGREWGQADVQTDVRKRKRELKALHRAITRSITFE